jgi:putative membrane protein
MKLRGLLLCATACVASTSAHAHGDASLRELLHVWTWNPWMLLGLALSCSLYATGALALWRRAGFGRGVHVLEVAAFAAAWLVIALALFSPLDRASDVFFSAHMAQHELLMVVAAPLFVLGRPQHVALWALPPALRARVTDVVRGAGASTAVRTVAAPFVLLIVHALVRWVWHVPVLFEAALRDEVVHGFQHAMFFATAVWFWWALVQGRAGRAGYGIAVVFVFATSLHTGALGALLTFAQRLWYPLYAARGAPYGVDALDDQGLAGLVMWVPAGVLLTGAGLALFAAWLGEVGRRARLASFDDVVLDERGSTL